MGVIGDILTAVTAEIIAGGFAAPGDTTFDAIIDFTTKETIWSWEKTFAPLAVVFPADAVSPEEVGNNVDEVTYPVDIVLACPVSDYAEDVPLLLETKREIERHFSNGRLSCSTAPYVNQVGSNQYYDFEHLAANRFVSVIRLYFIVQEES